MKKFFTSFLILSLATATSFAGAGLFDSFAIVRTASDTYYDAGASTANPDFNGANLGSFTASDNLQLGGQTKTFKNGSSDVTGASLEYRIWQVTESGSFSSIGYNFKANLANPGDQEWGTDGGAGSPFYTSNLLSGLSAGTYTLEVFTQITTNGIDADAVIASNNSGSNFEATFTVVPEPSAFALLAGMLGLTYIAINRRRA